MSKEQTKYAVRKLIKAYLVFNRGREVTSKEIANWINNPDNNFGLKTNIPSNTISRMINHSRHNNGSILYEVEKTCNKPMKFMLH